MKCRSVERYFTTLVKGYLKQQIEVMFRQLKTSVATLIAALALGQVAPAFADPADTLPDMGNLGRKHAFYRTRDANGRLWRTPATR